MTTTNRIRLLDGEEAAARIDELTEVLADCVVGGASVSFMAPLAPATAHAFWQQVARGVQAGERVLFVAESVAESAARDGAGRIDGTVQLVTAMPENQPQRAEVAKMLVHRRARRQGLAQRLLEALEAHAAAAGRTLLVLDTVTGGDAERLYARCGWTPLGSIPDYALLPDGRPCATTVFYKALAAG